MRDLVLVLLVLGSVLATTPTFAQRSLGVARAEPEQRLALVIGNSAYSQGSLKNPRNDATDMAKELESLGFEVDVQLDANKRQMEEAIRRLGAKLQRGGVGLFFYAGHAVQDRSARNFLIPLGANVHSEADLAYESVDVSLVLDHFEQAANRLNIVILDSCRDNPFRSFTRSTSRGLAAIQAATGTYVAYATQPGSTAADGSGRNGTFTKHLLASLRQPNTNIHRVFSRAAAGVNQETGKRQTPWVSHSLTGDFYFSAHPTTNAQSEAVRRAIEEANAKAKKERDELQSRMESMVTAALARQRAELEAARIARGENGAGQRAPLQVAPSSGDAQSSSQTPLQTSGSPNNLALPATNQVHDPTVVDTARQPSAGDRWVYERTLTLTGISSRIWIEAIAATNEGVVESAQTSGLDTQELVHPSSIQLMDTPFVVLSPYLQAFVDLTATQTLGSIDFERMNDCVGTTITTKPRNCNGTAEIIGRENIETPAGRFNAFRIDVVVRSSDWGAKFSYWYAPAVGRLVHATGRPGTIDTRYSNLEPFEYTLLAYQRAGGTAVGKTEYLRPSSTVDARP